MDDVNWDFWRWIVELHSTGCLSQDDEWTAHWVFWWSMEQIKRDWIGDDVECHINGCVVFKWEKDQRADRGKDRTLWLLKMNDEWHKRKNW